MDLYLTITLEIRYGTVACICLVRLGISFSDSVFVESVRFEPVEIGLVNEKTNIVIGDRYERLAEKVMRNRKERMYASKIDYLIDMNETNDIFSGHYEIQTMLFLVTIIFVIMLIAYHFGNILELNSYYQRIIIAVNKITYNIYYNHSYIQYIYLDMYPDLELYKCKKSW